MDFIANILKSTKLMYNTDRYGARGAIPHPGGPGF